MSLPIKIGNYRFERNLGNGTFGKVKRKWTLLPSINFLPTFAYVLHAHGVNDYSVMDLVILI